MKTNLPSTSVRGCIRDFIVTHADKLGTDVLEVGSRIHDPAAWWCSNRDLAQDRWTGIDMQPGSGVDRVADMHDLPGEWCGRFTGVLCSEVLEHVGRPWLALPEVYRVMAPDAWLVVTTLFAFPEHGYPDDFYRYTQHGLALLLEDAGFRNVETWNAGHFEMQLNDHGEPGTVRRMVPRHTFAVAQC